MKLIVNTPSTVKITPKKALTKERKKPFVFTSIYIKSDDPQHIAQTWESRPVYNPTEDDLTIQAQRFLTETGDYHPYLEGFDIDKKAGTISIGMGS